MHDDKNPAAQPPPAVGAGREPRPPYDPPRLTRKRSVRRATLFTGQGGPSAAPLVQTG